MKFKGANLRLDVASCHRLMLTSCEFLELRLPLDFDRKLRDFESTVRAETECGSHGLSAEGGRLFMRR
jgi:hypothetical protein